MMRTIGIVSEGPRDYDLLSAIIETVTGQECSFQRIQPEPNAVGEFGNGWKGVWKWCENHCGALEAYMNSATPKLDYLVVHMDGDVQRCEKEVHCECQRGSCDMPEDTHPLRCTRIIGNKSSCPVQLPCIEAHGSDPDSGAEFLRGFIQRVLSPKERLPVSYVIPYDSTDTWIVAAFDLFENYEVLHDPWRTIIAGAPKYHGIKIKNRPNKCKRTYEELIAAVCENWGCVVQRCPQAKRFDQEIRRFLMEDVEHS